jgi:hypothetical protein
VSEGSSCSSRKWTCSSVSLEGVPVNIESCAARGGCACVEAGAGAGGLDSGGIARRVGGGTDGLVMLLLGTPSAAGGLDWGYRGGRLLGELMPPFKLRGALALPVFGGGVTGRVVAPAEAWGDRKARDTGTGFTGGREGGCG